VIAVAAALAMAGIVMGDDVKKIGEDQDGKTIAIKDEKAVVIELAGNPTTGFSWDVAKVEGESLKQNGKVEYKADPAPERMVGGGGKFYATFDVKGEGKTAVTLEYKRPWEKDTPAAKTMKVTFDVAKK
jgi:inhibitor of cysteine peptidase